MFLMCLRCNVEMLSKLCRRKCFCGVLEKITIIGYFSEWNVFVFLQMRNREKGFCEVIVSQ